MNPADSQVSGVIRAAPVDVRILLIQNLFINRLLRKHLPSEHKPTPHLLLIQNFRERSLMTIAFTYAKCFSATINPFHTLQLLARTLLKFHVSASLGKRRTAVLQCLRKIQNSLLISAEKRMQRFNVTYFLSHAVLRR